MAMAAPFENDKDIRGRQRSKTTVPVSLASILKDKTAINHHKSAAEAQIYVSCGNVIAVR